MDIQMDKNEWSVAEAKQQFSEVLRRAEAHPQLIYRRNRLVAAVVPVDESGNLPGVASSLSLGEYVRETRDIVSEHGFSLPRTKRRPRKNALVKVLNELAGRHERSE
ncbi:MAG TPA: type II toxin-antitoxin system prevent-host-death family antitoxin [Thermoanaerobaculia bacterium]|nr:type II toxin-antitoxin system prevent-host-death family antitoxin [Thermoanaerobaculia bacterium]